jgi:asparagine synthase (glutamine-hydrolysing)
MAEYSAIFRPEVLQELLSSHMERQANLGYHLWGLMILFLWMKKWQIQLPVWEEIPVLEKTGVFI